MKKPTKIHRRLVVVRDQIRTLTAEQVGTVVGGNVFTTNTGTGCRPTQSGVSDPCETSTC